jgi:hypothetical protein
MFGSQLILSTLAITTLEAAHAAGSWLRRRLGIHGNTSGGSGTPPFLLLQLDLTRSRAIAIWRKFSSHHHHHHSQHYTHGVGAYLGNLIGSGNILRVWDLCSLNILLCSSSYSSDVMQTYTPHTPHPPNQHPHPVYVTPTPTPPTWKSQKSDSLSRQHRVLALSIPTTLPGHRIACLWLQRQRRIRLQPPYAAPPMPSTQRHRDCQNMQVGHHHLRGSSSSGPPITLGWHGTNRGAFYAPSDLEHLQ